MIKVEKNLPPGVGIIWYMEKQFYTRPVKKALRRACKKYKYPLSVLTDERQKPNKYTRMVRMEPEYSSGNVVYNVEEENDPDMVEGNLQVKGIEPGYNTADDARMPTKARGFSGSVCCLGFGRLGRKLSV
jgi:hypothetical protein